MDNLPENFLVRSIKIEDADDIGRIQASITKSPAKIDFRQVIEEQVQGDKDASFVAEVDNRIVGFMISYIVYGGFGLEKSAWIATLGVDPQFMGQGIGKRLAKEILRACQDRGIKHVFTSVRWDSVDLLSFFKTLDFDRSNFINLRKELDF
ncbi:MAG: GNAT family N-acetyltransferase [Pseudomonadota bacterium]